MRTTLGFLTGFIAGMLFLLVLLWGSGSLHSARPVALAASDGLPATADRTAPGDWDVPDLLIPVEGADASKIRDSYMETRAKRRHEAADIMAPRGTPVLAVDAGRVVKLFLSRAGGITIYQFDPSGTWCYYYAHLDRYAAGVNEETAVRKGQVIGYVGSSGNASPNAPHLHFAIFRLGPEKHWWQGTPVDPYPVLLRHAARMR